MNYVLKTSIPEIFMQAKPENERRYFPRWEVDNKVFIRHESDSQGFQSRTADLNCSGTCIYTKKPLDIGQKLKMVLYLTDDISIHVKGQALWIKPESDHQLVGVQFHEVSQEVQSLILAHAFEFKRKDVVKYWFKGWGG